MKCDECDEKLKHQGVMSTLVAYYSPEGHNHNNNCRTLWLKCKNGHNKYVELRNRCYNPSCDWVGKETCFCHKGKKVFLEDLKNL